MNVRKVLLGLLALCSANVLLFLLAVKVGLNDWGFVTFGNVVKMTGLNLFVSVLYNSVAK